MLRVPRFVRGPRIKRGKRTFCTFVNVTGSQSPNKHVYELHVSYVLYVCQEWNVHRVHRCYAVHVLYDFPRFVRFVPFPRFFYLLLYVHHEKARGKHMVGQKNVRFARFEELFEILAHFRVSLFRLSPSKFWLLYLFKGQNWFKFLTKFKNKWVSSILYCSDISGWWLSVIFYAFCRHFSPFFFGDIE